MHTRRGTNIFRLKGGTNTLSLKGGAEDDVDEEYVSEANIHVSKASKLSAGARIFRGPEILVKYKTKLDFGQPKSLKLNLSPIGL